jgi:hypothetical protein
LILKNCACINSSVTNESVKHLSDLAKINLVTTLSKTLKYALLWINGIVFVPKHDFNKSEKRWAFQRDETTNTILIFLTKKKKLTKLIHY